jgi:hypothetical protein
MESKHRNVKLNSRENYSSAGDFYSEDSVGRVIHVHVIYADSVSQDTDLKGPQQIDVQISFCHLSSKLRTVL